MVTRKICPKLFLISVFDPCIRRGQLFWTDFSPVKGQLIHGQILMTVKLSL